MTTTVHYALLLHALAISADVEGPLPTPTTILHQENWTWEASICIPLFASALWYVVGAIHRGNLSRLRWRHVSFVLGWLSLALALISPLHRLGDALFSAHMLQHEILILLAAPLLALSHPAVTFLYLFSPRYRRLIGGVVSSMEKFSGIAILISPLAAFLLHAIALWAWHIPYLYEETLRSESVHAMQHLSFFLSGLLFWSALYGAGRSTMSYGAGVLYVFGTAIHCGALGALLTFSSVLWYPIYADRTAAWRLSPLQDQQLGGLLMWVPSGIVFIAIGIVLFARWLSSSDDRLCHSTVQEASAKTREYP